MSCIVRINIKEFPCNINREWNFIYNRFDLIYSENNYFYKIDNSEDEFYVQGHANGKTLFLALWMYPLPTSLFDELCVYIKKTQKQFRHIKTEYYPQSKSLFGSFLFCQFFRPGNHWKLDLPSSMEELSSVMGKKFNYNVKREKRLITEQLGDYKIEEYSGENIPKSIVERYYAFKEQTHSITYNIDASEYINRYHVTNVYTLSICNSIEAMVFSCEQTDTVYLENLSYNPEYSKFSLGKILYNLYLETLINKKKKHLFLGSGHQQYKSWYGGIENQVNSVTFYYSRAEYIGDAFSIIVRRCVNKVRGIGNGTKN